MRINSSIKQYGPLGFHVLLGLISPFFGSIATIYGLLVSLYFFISLLQTRNRNGEAHKAAIYIASLELWLRMNGAALPWEFGKIACIGFLLLGMFFERRQRYNWTYILLLLLLIPAIILSAPPDFRAFREFLTFQLGGLILLVFSLIYFSGRRLSLSQFIELLRYALFPLVTVLVHVILRSPSLSQMRFELGANFGASAGYGPNQVSTMLGLGIIITGFVYLWKLPPLISRRIDLILLILFLVRALLTFSRGGVFVSILILSFAYVSMLLVQRKLSLGKLVSFGLLITLIGGVAFFVDSLTGGVLLERYKGETYTTSRGLEKKDLESISSGRSEIIRTDVEMFLDHPIFGVGIGVSNLLRPDYGFENISHIEQTRLLAEHGIFGFIFLISLILLPFTTYFKRRGINKSILLIFTLLSFLTMFHSATRMAMVGLYFGFGFLKVYFENNPLRRQQAVDTRVLADQH